MRFCWDYIMAPKVTKNGRFLGDSFLKSEKFSCSQNYLENPLGEWRVQSLNRFNTASFLHIGTDCCQFCQLGHIVKKKKSYFYTVGLCSYIKKVISVHLKCCSRWAGLKHRRQRVEGTADWRLVLALVLMKLIHSSFIVVFFCFCFCGFFWYHLY